MVLGTDEKVEIANKLQILKNRLDPFLVNLILDPTGGLELIRRMKIPSIFCLKRE